MALGAYLGSTRIITENMLMRAAECLPTLIHESDMELGERVCVYVCVCVLADTRKSLRY